MSTLLIGVVALVFCSSMMVAFFFIWKKVKEKQAADEEAENKRFLNQPVAQDDSVSSPTAATDCQTVSNDNLAWPGHRGLTELATWGNFNFDKCTTYPTAYTTTPQFSQLYQTLGVGSPKNDPALTDAQKIDDSGTNIVENIISKKKLELSTNGVLSLKTDTGTVVWSTPPGSGSNFSLKFDSNNYNSGNLCVFDKDGNTPWCMLPRVSVPTSACSGSGSNCPPGSYTGSDLQGYQRSLLAAGKMKTTSDTAPRFVMIDDAGQFCMYRGTPGNIQGSYIMCK